MALTAAACTCIGGATNEFVSLGEDIQEIQPTLNALATRQSLQLTLAAEGEVPSDITLQEFLTEQAASGDPLFPELENFSDGELQITDKYAEEIAFGCDVVAGEVVEERLSITISEVTELLPEDGSIDELQCTFQTLEQFNFVINNRVFSSEQEAGFVYTSLLSITALFSGETIEGAWDDASYSQASGALTILNGAYMVSFSAPLSFSTISQDDFFDFAEFWVQSLPPPIELEPASTATPTPSPTETVTPTPEGPQSTETPGTSPSPTISQ